MIKGFKFFAGYLALVVIIGYPFLIYFMIKLVGKLGLFLLIPLPLIIYWLFIGYEFYKEGFFDA